MQLGQSQDFSLLRRTSMSLLLCFDSLMDTRSVTLTAARLNKSQPAISRDLARLRTLLKDPVFVFISKRLVPTERALALHRQVREALAGLEHALGEGQPFRASELAGVINIGAAAHIELLLAAPLTLALQKEAPGLTVRFQPVHGDFSPDDLDSASMDLAIGLFQGLPLRFPRQVLFEDERVGVLSSSHPLAKRQRFGLQDLQHVKWLAFSHMYGKQTNFDRALQDSGYNMRFSAYVSNFGLAPYFLMETDYATTMPRLIAEKYCRYFDLGLVRLPAELREARMLMVWSERNERDRLSLWLRGMVMQVVNGLLPDRMRPGQE